jgi:hypothetical protein
MIMAMLVRAASVNIPAVMSLGGSRIVYRKNVDRIGRPRRMAQSLIGLPNFRSVSSSPDGIFAAGF